MSYHGIVRFFKILVSATLIIILVTFLDLESLFRIWSSLKINYLLLGTFIFLLSNVFAAVQWWVLLKEHEIKVTSWKGIAYYFVGLFFNNFFPSSVGGDMVKIYDVVTRHGGTKAKVFAATFMDRLLGFLALTTPALVAGLFIFKKLDIGPAFVIVMFFWLFFVLMLLFFFAGGHAQKIAPYLQKIKFLKLGERLIKLYKEIKFYKMKMKLLGSLFLLSLVVQFLRILVHYYVALSMGIDYLNFSIYLVIIPVIGVLIMLPSINGIGVREGSGAILFSLVGLTNEQGVAMQLLSYFIMVAVSLGGGVIFLLRKSHKVKI